MNKGKPMENTKVVLWLLVVLSLTFTCDCQSSTLIMNVAEMKNNDKFTFVCNVSPPQHLARWTFQNTSFAESTQTLIMRYQNGVCTVSPNDSFISNGQVHSYTCNSTVYQINIHYSTSFPSINNHILACRDALEPERIGSTWIILIKPDSCSYCKPTMSFDAKEITEGDSVLFICTLSSYVPYVNWKCGSNTTAMGIQKGLCTTSSSGTTFLDNKDEYMYSCNQTVYQVTRMNVRKNEHNDIYMCTPAFQAEGKGSNWIIKVKVPVTTVSMTPAKSPVDVKENTVVEFTCETSIARPAASVYWYRYPNENSNNMIHIANNITTTADYNDLRVTTSTLSYFPTRQDNNMKIYCEANNTVNTSPIKSNQDILLNVLYKADDPYILQGNEYRVIENTLGTLTCTVKGGNPTPTLSWRCNNISTTHKSTINSNENVTKTLTWSPSRSDEGNCTCTSKQTGFRNETASTSVAVLYPPSKPTFSVNGYNIDSNASFIKGTTKSIICTSDSKPSPDSYTWTGPSAIDSPNQSRLTFNTIEKKDAGEYGCSVRNTMNISDKGPVNGMNNSTVNIVVLYPPVALRMNNMSILKEDNLTTRCPYIAGMPFETSIVWTRNIDEKQWKGELLNIQHVEKKDAAIYSCNVSNVMKPSGEHIYIIGQDTQIFHLDVLYEAIITSFTIEGIASTTVIKNESDPVPFNCSADSNPIATMILVHESKILKTQTSNSLEYKLVHGTCSNAGTYICSAGNKYNGDVNARSEVQLFVNCYPRIANEIQQNITSEKNGTITISLNVVAYPPPEFIWYKMIKGIWTLILDDDNFALDSSAVHSNLTIRSVGAEDFTSYKVHVENDFGEMDQPYYLLPYDKPDPPINFTHIESHTTTSSIHLVWTPGSDNGPPQTFNIKYIQSSGTTWTYLNITDNGEQSMDLELTDLTENTQYIFVIFASNVKGKSSEISFTATTLKAIDNSSKSPGALIGGLTGGISGVVIIGIVIIVIIRRYPLLKGKGNKNQDIRRPDSDDSDDEDGLVDNPMYESSSNVAAVASTSASTSTDIYSKPVKPQKPIVPGKGDIYAVVDKTKKQVKEGNGKTAPGNNKKQDADVYENFELDDKQKGKQDGKQEPKLKIVNKDGLIYADLLFNGKPPGEKMVIIGDDPTPYSQVDFTKKADPLPESDEEDEK